jgi:cytoskeleton protein RodZ
MSSKRAAVGPGQHLSKGGPGRLVAGELNLTMQRPASLCAQHVGSDLRAARERLGWSLRDTSTYLRIRQPFLQALEDGRIGDVPGVAYARGFIRNYAFALGVDPEEMVRRFNEETGSGTDRTELNFPTPLPQRRVPPGAVVLLGTALAVVGYASWYGVSGDRGGSVPVEQVPARLAPLALPIVPPPPEHVAAAATRPTALAQAQVTPSVSPSQAEASVPTPGSLATIEPAPIAIPPGTPAPANQVVLTATQDAWVQVKDGSGKVMLSKLMHAGDSWTVPDQPAGAAPLVLTTGNAGGTDLTLDGRKLPALGGDGVVRRGVALDPASLRAGSGSSASAQTPG